MHAGGQKKCWGVRQAGLAERWWLGRLEPAWGHVGMQGGPLQGVGGRALARPNRPSEEHEQVSDAEALWRGGSAPARRGVFPRPPQALWPLGVPWPASIMSVFGACSEAKVGQLTGVNPTLASIRSALIVEKNDRARGNKTTQLYPFTWLQKEWSGGGGGFENGHILLSQNKAVKARTRPRALNY